MKTKFQTFTIIVVMLLISHSVSATVINLISGNGSVGNADSDISFLLGPVDSGFGATFTAADFANASSGPAAQIITRNGNWLDPSAFNGNAALGTNAQWISDSQNGASQGFTALYAIDFFNPFSENLAGVLDFYWSVDNDLGANLFGNTGLYINGSAVLGSPTGGSFGNNTPALGLDIGSLLVAGTNTLFINARDFGGPGGLLFSAKLTIDGVNNPPSSVSTPSALLLIGLGFLGVIVRKRKKA